MKLKNLFILLGSVALLLVMACHHVPLEPLPILPSTNPVIIADASNPKDSICFYEEVRPILISNCAKSGCHNDTTHRVGIVLNSYLNTTRTISGNLLMQSITDNGELRMPPLPSPQLDSAQVATIQKWIYEGMKNDIDCQGPCDTTQVKYSTVIAPIIQNNCIGCHRVSGTILDSYTKVLATVTNGKFLGSINHTAGFRFMPEGGGKISDCKIKQIKIWINAGAPDN